MITDNKLLRNTKTRKKKELAEGFIEDAGLNGRFRLFLFYP
jgi:hypothetical protein